jgi:protease I
MKRKFFYFLSLFLLLFSLAGADSVCLIIAHRNFQETEYGTTREKLENEGHEIKVAASSKSTPARGMGGRMVQPDLTLEEVVVADYRAIIFIGGSGVIEEYFNNSRAHSICQEAVAQGKILAAICVAPVVLANAGVLNGKRTTVFPGYESSIRGRGAIYVNEEVVVDGLIITAKGPEASSAFAQKIAEKIASASAEEEISWSRIKSMFR